MNRNLERNLGPGARAGQDSSNNEQPTKRFLNQKIEKIASRFLYQLALANKTHEAAGSNYGCPSVSFLGLVRGNWVTGAALVDVSPRPFN